MKRHKLVTCWKIQLWHLQIQQATSARHETPSAQPPQPPRTPHPFGTKKHHTEPTPSDKRRRSERQGDEVSDQLPFFGGNRECSDSRIAGGDSRSALLRVAPTKGVKGCQDVEPEVPGSEEQGPSESHTEVSEVVKPALEGLHSGGSGGFGVQVVRVMHPTRGSPNIGWKWR